MKSRLTIVAAIAVAVLVLPAVAVAGANRTTTGYADAYWTQIDEPVDGIVGYHHGNLSVYAMDDYVDVWVFIEDVYCPEGVEPGHGGGHGEFIFEGDEPLEEEPYEDPCEYSYREGYGADMTFEMSGNDLASAHLTGDLTIFGGHGGDELGVVPVDMTWTGEGSTWKSMFMGQDRGEFGFFMFRDRSSNRGASVDGNIGPMGFNPDASGGWMGFSSGLFIDRFNGSSR